MTDANTTLLIGLTCRTGRQSWQMLIQKEGGADPADVIHRYQRQNRGNDLVDVQIRSGESAAEEITFLSRLSQKLCPDLAGNSGAQTPEGILFTTRNRPTLSLHAQPVLHHFEQVYQWLAGTFNDHSQDERDPFQTLVTCILSLRTRDPVTDAAAKRLFREIPDAQTMLEAHEETIARLIYPVGMYRQKARQLKRIAAILAEHHHGQPPSELDELTKLPGVGRKTANLVRSFAYHLPALCVDTHVHRITNRWGLVRTTTPDETELALKRILPEEYWQGLNPLLVQMGQQICRPTSPRCHACELRAYCAYDQLCEEHRLAGKLNLPSHPSLKFPPPDERPAAPREISPFE
ncbi:MAG: endonuclease III [Lentisphaerae bacterium]|nr:MAG: endonuclease III [Lentisphaerota bacterium]